MSGALALLALAALTPAASPERKAQLGVTATVVRPASISAAPSVSGVAVVAIGNSHGVVVLADGEPIAKAKGDIRVTFPATARSVTITLNY